MESSHLGQWIGEHRLTKLVSMYSDAGVSGYRLIDCTRDNGRDMRFIYIIDQADGGSIVIKLARSAFATPERVEAWGRLTYQYRGAGIYCPLFIPSRTKGTFHETIESDDREFMVWAEEFKAYRTMDELMDEARAKGQGDSTEDSLRARIRGDEWTRQFGDHLGRVCHAGLSGLRVDFPTVYVLFDTFAPDDACDENLENSTRVYETLIADKSVDSGIVEDIHRIHLEQRARLEPHYRKLPKGMVQGDLSWNNVLVDENMDFAGVIDFNLSGYETLIRYAMNEGFDHPTGELGDTWTDPVRIAQSDRRLRVFMDAFRRHYHLTAGETTAFGMVYNVVRPFTWPMVSDLLHFHRLGNRNEVRQRLKWMLWELTRTDITDAVGLG